MATTRRAPAKKRGRRAPVQSRARASRDAILRASAQLLGRSGVTDFTTNHVAKRAGVSIGTLYEYFRDKDAILDALLSAHLDDAESAFSVAIAALPEKPGSVPLPVLVRGLVGAMVAVHEADPRLHRVLSAQAMHRPVVLARVRKLEASIIAAVARALALHPSARVTDPDLAARVCVHAADALTHRWIVDDRGAGAERLTAELTTLLVRYLTGTDASTGGR